MPGRSRHSHASNFVRSVSSTENGELRTENEELNLLQSLHIVNAGNLAHAGDDRLQMLQVGDVEHDVDVGLAVAGARFDISDICFGITDHGSDLLQHAPLVITEES